MSFHPGILSGGPPKLQFEVSLVGWVHHLGPFPSWDSRLLFMRDFPAPFKSGCRLTQFGDTCAVTFLYCLFSLNDCMLKLSQVIYKKIEIVLCNEWFLLLANPSNVK